MKIFYTICCLALIGSSMIITRTNFETSTHSARQYIKIAENMQKGITVDIDEWKRLFTTPPYDMMIAGGAIDTSLLKKVMWEVYSPMSQNRDTTAIYQYHRSYKKNLKKIKKYLDQVERSKFKQNIVNALSPYLPERLKPRIQNLKFYYLVYGSEEATGMSGMVFNDAMLTYKADSFAPGLISAHECIHAVVSESFQHTLKQNINYDSNEFALFSFLQSVTEEGVADLIDKEVLSAKSSPLRRQVISLINDDERLGKMYLARLNSLLIAAAKNDTVAFKGFKYPMELNNFLGKNGGHIPGRYMAGIIKKNGYLNEMIDQIDSPYFLLLIYQKSVEGKEGYVQFSHSGLDYLGKLSRKLIKK